MPGPRKRCARLFPLAQVHGSTRRTRDVDVVPATDEDNLSRLVDALRELGVRIRTESDPDGLPFATSVQALRDMRLLNLVTRLGVGPHFHPIGYARLPRPFPRRPPVPDRSGRGADRFRRGCHPVEDGRGTKQRPRSTARTATPRRRRRGHHPRRAGDAKQACADSVNAGRRGLAAGCGGEHAAAKRRSSDRRRESASTGGPRRPSPKRGARHQTKRTDSRRVFDDRASRKLATAWRCRRRTRSTRSGSRTSHSGSSGRQGLPRSDVVFFLTSVTSPRSPDSCASTTPAAEAATARDRAAGLSRLRRAVASSKPRPQAPVRCGCDADGRRGSVAISPSRDP